MEAYSEASKQVFEVFDDTSPIVEGLSIDEAFLDVGGLRRVAGTPRDIAVELRRKVRDRVGLPITVGIARTKFLAKVASVSAKPDGLLVVEPDGELDFLHPLPVERLWGVGPKTAAKLHNVGLFKVGEVAELTEATLISLLGAASGRHLHALAHNRDPRPVVVGRRRGSIGSQHAIGRFGERKTPQELDTVLVALVDRVTRRMRKAQRVGRTVVLRVRFDDFGRATRSHTLPHSTAHTETVLGAARDLLVSVLPIVAEQGCTLVGISIGNLDDSDSIQVPLPFEAASGTSLDATVDGLRERFGASAVTRAVLLGRDPGVTMPMLPD
jgi:DNA polymerase-4